ncbi:polysaccharide pyruvyl transferase family protein [Halomonas getboli]|uniref:polysaccharide pyruvyl transferase family protein n=1 Tax=Halomonas getboli TaxID=2935862 RepID=UPI001FFF7E46|nr:polysaccharide pyruvyl transferase family protein [Halomonas getboli]MCK2182998.1 polysaccharide pyruvyl transferase family protein [Halomonas getboli]
MSNRKEKIILHGAFQNENFGDTLLLSIFSKKVKELDAGLQILGSNVSSHAASFCGIEKASFFDKVNPRNPFIYCGGGYFGERKHKKNKWGVNLLLRHLWVGVLSAALKRKYAILATGFGSLSLLWYRLPAIYVVNKASRVCFRDAESVDFYNDYSGMREVDLVADAVLSLEKSELYDAVGVERSDLKEFSGDNQRRLVIHLPGTANDQFQRKMIASSANKVLQKFPALKVVAISDNSFNKEQDFFSWLNVKDVECKPFTGPKRLLEEIDESDYVITTKLHVGICAAVLEKRVLSFASHPKTKRFYDQIGRRELHREIHSVNSLQLERSLEMFLSDDVLPAKIPSKVKSMASETWEVLEEFIDNSKA